MVTNAIMFSDISARAAWGGRKSQVRILAGDSNFDAKPWRKLWVMEGVSVVGPAWLMPMLVRAHRGKSRMTLLVDRSRVQLLQDITPEDAFAEGFTGHDPKGQYREYWGTIHTAPGSRWEDNPEVAVLEFQTFKHHVDSFEMASLECQLIELVEVALVGKKMQKGEVMAKPPPETTEEGR
ncbi:hypothetical protein UFOVP1299_21 [uncultured Caudovirales phage]|uniref:Uncharacterized protein n=1 Tax=uncultured Caudovirales phage TaxID=2100421 RepID=A0A6J5RPN2_9CAUD|nr:hypothetical protein UFOVP1299_21 [uncultured Caudovirales phage]